MFKDGASLQETGDFEKPSPLSDIIPHGGFRTLKSCHLTNRLVLSKKMVPVMGITSGLYGGTSRLGTAPVVSLVRRSPRLYTAYKRQIRKARTLIRESTPPNRNPINLELELVPALYVVGEGKKAITIIEKAEKWADTCQDHKERISSKVRIAQIMALVDEDRAEAVSLKELKKYRDLENPELEVEIRDEMLRTMAQVATSKCIEQIPVIVNSIEDEDQKLRAMVTVASELSGRFLESAQQTVTISVAQSDHPIRAKEIADGTMDKLAAVKEQGVEPVVSETDIDVKAQESDTLRQKAFVNNREAVSAESIANKPPVENKLDDLAITIIPMAKEWLGRIRYMSSSLRSLAAGAIACMLDQFDRSEAESALEDALRYGGYLPKQDQRQFLGPMGSIPTVLNDLAVIKEHREAEEERHPITVGLEKSDQGQKDSDQILPDKLRAKALVDSAALSLGDGKEDEAVQTLERALVCIERTQDPISLIGSLAILTIASSRRYTPSFAQRIPLALRKELTSFITLEASIIESEPMRADKGWEQEAFAKSPSTELPVYQHISPEVKCEWLHQAIDLSILSDPISPGPEVQDYQQISPEVKREWLHQAIDLSILSDPISPGPEVQVYQQILPEVRSKWLRRAVDFSIPPSLISPGSELPDYQSISSEVRSKWLRRAVDFSIPPSLISPGPELPDYQSISSEVRREWLQPAIDLETSPGAVSSKTEVQGYQQISQEVRSKWLRWAIDLDSSPSPISPESEVPDHQSISSEVRREWLQRAIDLETSPGAVSSKTEVQGYQQISPEVRSKWLRRAVDFSIPPSLISPGPAVPDYQSISSEVRSKWLKRAIDLVHLGINKYIAMQQGPCLCKSI